MLKNRNITVIFTSPQKRAQETARIISQVISKGKIKVQTIEELHETTLGHLFEGLTSKQVREKYPKISLDYSRNPAKIKVAGENFAKMAERMVGAINKCVKKHPSQNLIFVSHRDPILAALLKVAKRNFNDLHKVKGVCDTGSINEIWSVGKHLICKAYLAR